MKILAIETSCDETAVAILDCEGDEREARFRMLGNGLLSQIDIHKEYGGVYPALAKRAHAKNLVPLLSATLEEAEMLHEDTQALPDGLIEKLGELLSREPELLDALREFLAETEKPALDAIAVTHGPGLEPALWVGVNFARALSLAWGIPVVPVNHMEGHFLAALASCQDDILTLKDVRMPVLGLLISGGHTELVLMRDWRTYELLGATRDDAVGEAFDKVARMMGLPYPGGPEISKLAEKDRVNTPSIDTRSDLVKLPRPMIDSGDFDFSFSGLKTAVLYFLKERGAMDETDTERLARAFEDAVGDVLYAKASRALEKSGAKTLIMGGGVSANVHLGRLFAEKIAEEHSGVALRIPERALTTDNAVMIGIAGYYRAKAGNYADIGTLRADGNLSLG